MGKNSLLMDGMDVSSSSWIVEHRRSRLGEMEFELADIEKHKEPFELMLSGGWPYVIFGCQGYSLDMHLLPSYPQVDVKWKEGV